MTKFKKLASKNLASASGRQLVAQPAVSVIEATAAPVAFEVHLLAENHLKRSHASGVIQYELV